MDEVIVLNRYNEKATNIFLVFLCNINRIFLIPRAHPMDGRVFIYNLIKNIKSFFSSDPNRNIVTREIALRITSS